MSDAPSTPTRGAQIKAAFLEGYDVAIAQTPGSPDEMGGQWAWKISEAKRLAEVEDASVSSQKGRHEKADTEATLPRMETAHGLSGGLQPVARVGRAQDEDASTDSLSSVRAVGDLGQTLCAFYDLTTWLVSVCPTGRVDLGASQPYHDALLALTSFRDNLRRHVLAHDESCWMPEPDSQKRLELAARTLALASRAVSGEPTKDKE